MIISFTGAQSTGKSTLLNKCKEEFGDKFEYFPEITRQIRDQFGVSINESGTNLTQYLILGKHVENTLIAEKSTKHSILDRCVLDGIVYTTWLRIKLKISHEAHAAMTEVFESLISKIGVIFYTDPKDVELVNDGERSIDPIFRNDIINIFEYIMASEPCKNNMIVRLSGTVEERMETIRKTLKGHGISL